MCYRGGNDTELRKKCAAYKQKLKVIKETEDKLVLSYLIQDMKFLTQLAQSKLDYLYKFPQGIDSLKEGINNNKETKMATAKKKAKKVSKPLTKAKAKSKAKKKK